MAKLSFDDGDGVWRTIGGRHIFIRDGESIASAMKRSGKFKSTKKKGQRKFEDVDKEFHEHAQKMEKNYEEFGGNSVEDEKKLNELSKERDEALFNKGKKQDINIDPESYAKYIKEPKNEFDKLAIEYKNVKDEMTEYNTKASNLYSGHGWYDDQDERAKKELSPDKYKEYKKNADLYEAKRKELSEIYDKMERTGLPKEESEAMKQYNQSVKEHEDYVKYLSKPDREFVSFDKYKETQKSNGLKQDKKQQLNNQSNDKFYTKKDGTKVYDPYKGTPYERKYDSVKDASEDPNSKMNKYIREKARRKAYQKYLKLHPTSELSFEDFKDMKKYQ